MDSGIDYEIIDVLIVRHLSLADNIIVLDKDGKTIEQGKFAELRARSGFVSRLVLHPDILYSDTGSVPTADNPSGIAPTSIPKAFQGPSANDVADLARQIGDVSVYKYYLKSIGWKIGMANAMGSIVYMFGSKITRTCSLLYKSLANMVSAALWLNLYADGGISSLSVFTIGYVAFTVVAFAGSAVTL
jgi:ATP-binding cassette subfamily C (CFTR/MRP) protein 1